MAQNEDNESKTHNTEYYKDELPQPQVKSVARDEQAVITSYKTLAMLLIMSRCI